MSWSFASNVLQLLGVAALALGIARTRYELRPGGSFIEQLQSLKDDAVARLDALRRRPRTAVDQQATTGSALAGGPQDGASATGHTDRSELEKLTGRVEVLERRVTRLQAQIDENREEITRVGKRIAAKFSSLQHLHLGGLTVEALGAALIASGLWIAIWPSWWAVALLLPPWAVGGARWFRNWRRRTKQA